MMECCNQKRFDRMKPFLAVVFLQFGYAGMDVLSKAALNKGMSNYVLVVYRHIAAFVVIAPFALILEKKVRPKMTFSIFMKLVALSTLEPVIDQNLYFLGMKYTTATFAVAMYNVLPAITFVMAYIFKLEKIKMKSVRSQAKVVGTLATVAGAMVMTLFRGPILNIFGTHGNSAQIQHNSGANLQHAIKGSIMITIGCFSCACFMILQVSGIVALIMERGDYSVWSLNWDTKLLAAVYSVSFLKFITITSSIFLAEKIYLGRVVGAVVIILGLYLVVWGKSKDYDTPSSIIKDEALPVMESRESNDKDENPNPNDKVITKSNFVAIIRDEQV
ncbi:hypothetical protein RYX36_031475 [Vicia faba]